MSAASPTAGTASRELSDWFNPMLVKELRQGLRGGVFAVSFLALQGFLIFSMLTEMTAKKDLSVFWPLVGLVLLVVMPLRGLVAVGWEIRSHTLDLIRLTRLNPLDIVFGKWSALYAQSLLFVITVLPYMLLRYYVIGVEAVGQLTMLMQMLAISAILTAGTVGLSTHLGTTVKLIGTTVVALVGLPIAAMFLRAIMHYPAHIGSAGTMSDSSDPVMLIWMTIFTVLTVILLVFSGACGLARRGCYHPAGDRP